MQNLKNQDDSNTDSRKVHNGDVVFIRQLSMPPAQKATKAKPNILREKRVAIPTRLSDSKNEIRRTLDSVKSAAPLIQEFVDCRDKDGTEVNNFGTINANVMGGPMEVETTENLLEILVDEDQIQFMDKPNKLSTHGENFVCRTCLTLTASEKCKKLFNNRRAEECHKLREKLVYIADEMNFKASFNAAVCQKCVTLIDITYAYKKQVKGVESRIRKKLKQSVGYSMVDLRSLLEDGDSGEVSQDSVRCQNARQVMKLDDSEVEKSIRGSRVQDMEKTCTETVGDAVSSRDIVGGGSILGEHNQRNNASNISSRSKYSNLEEYLLFRREELDKIREELPTWQRARFNTPPIKVPDFDRILSEKVKAPVKKSTESLDEIENRILNPEIVTQLNTESVEADCNRDGETNQSTEPNMGEHLAKRQGRARKYDYTNQFSNLSLRVLKNERRPLDGETASKVDNGQAEGTQSSPGYLYLFNTGAIPKRKPDVPKTWNLFDEEHDKYFEKLVGDVGWYMARKWLRFASRPRGIGDGPFLCEDCGFFTAGKLKFHRHMGTHKTKTTMCSYCGKLVRSSSHLKYHIEVKHMEPSYECKHCGKKFHLSSNLSIHISKLHKRRSYMVQCQHCGKFMRNWSLKSHMSRHSNKVFTCDVCNKSFSCKNSLYRHSRKHSNERYPCSSCLKTYKSKSILKQHRLQIHERISEWSCEICDRLLSRREHLKRHMKIVHGLDLPNKKKEHEVREEKNNECDESTASPQAMEVNVQIMEQAENVIVYRYDETESFFFF